MSHARRGGVLAMLTLMFAGCTSAPTVPPVPRVELSRFMGDWYVIANIPTPPEEGAYNAVESYRLDANGTIATTFTFREGGFDGPQKTMRPRGFVRPDTENAVWGMQFIWPIKAEYVIAHVDPEYRETIIARSRRDYVWIMARTPVIPDADYARLTQQVRELGYDVSKLQKVPQRW